MSKLTQAVPVLASLDIAKTLEFYQQKLACSISYQDENYGIVQRDQISVHFWKCNDPEIPKQTSCYVFVEEIDALYQELSVQKIIHPNGKLEDKPWGVREFAILDSDGNLIKFGERL